MPTPECDSSLSASRRLGELPAVFCERDQGIAEAVSRDGDREQDPAGTLTYRC